MTARPMNDATPMPADPGLPPRERAKKRRRKTRPVVQVWPVVDGAYFTVNVSVSMGEMKHWAPERISAYFAGWARILAAVNGAIR